MYIISAICTAVTFYVLYLINHEFAWYSLFFIATLWARPVTRYLTTLDLPHSAGTVIRRVRSKTDADIANFKLESSGQAKTELQQSVAEDLELRDRGKVRIGGKRAKASEPVVSKLKK